MLDDSTQTALIVMAIAVSLQTLLLIALTAVGVVAWRRAQREIGVRYAALTTKVDDAVEQARRAASAVERVSYRASDLLSQAWQAADAVAAVAAMPARFMRSLAASATSGLLAGWRRGRTRRVA